LLGSNHKIRQRKKNNSTPNFRGKPKSGKTTGRLEPENFHHVEMEYKINLKQCAKKKRLIEVTIKSLIHSHKTQNSETQDEEL